MTESVPLVEQNLLEVELRLIAAGLIKPLSIPTLPEGIAAYIFTPPETKND